MHSPEKNYLPAAGRDWLLPFYDPFTWLLGIGAIHNKLVHQATIEAGQHVLEIGCGTGNLAILVGRLNPNAHVVGIDPDPKALARANRKAQRSRLNLKFDRGFSEDLPHPAGSFDRVLSAFMFHHVQPAAKMATIQEVYRVLKPGGSLHLVDFEEAQSPERGGGLHGFLASKMQGRHGSSPQSVVLGLLRDAGFKESQELDHQATLMGRIVYYKAVRS